MVAAAAMGRAGHLRAAAARWLRARGFSTNGNNGGGPATPGGGAATNRKVTSAAATGGGAASNGSGATNWKATVGGGAANNFGGAANNGGATCRGSDGCEGVTQLRTEIFTKTRQFWDRYNVGAEKDRQLFESVAELRKEIAMNYVSSRVQLVSSTYKMVASTGLVMLGLAIGVSPYVKQRIVKNAATEVEEILATEAGAGSSPAAPRDGKN